MTSVSIIIPTLNEAENLRSVLDDLTRNGIAREQVIVIDGGSTDGTHRAAWGTGFRQQSRKGKGNAIVCGMERALWSGSDIVVMMDADGSHSAEDVLAVITAIANGAEFAKGSRFIEGGGSVDFTPFRRAGAWLLNRWFDFRFGVKHTDLCYGLLAFDATALDRLIKGLPSIGGNSRHRTGDGFEIETLINCLAARLQLNTVEVPSIERHRIHGRSHLRPVRDGLRVLRTIEQQSRISGHFSILLHRPPRPTDVLGPLDMEKFRAQSPVITDDDGNEGSTP